VDQEKLDSLAKAPAPGQPAPVPTPSKEAGLEEANEKLASLLGKNPGRPR
jgi:hypothetical protein